MSQENKSDSELLENVESLLVGNGSVLHEIPVDPENKPNLVIRVWVKELSFLQIQNALKEVVQLTTDGEVNIDLAGYWKYMLNECVERTEPKMSKVQLYALKPDIAARVTALLPQPQDLVAGPLGDGLTA